MLFMLILKTFVAETKEIVKHYSSRLLRVDRAKAVITENTWFGQLTNMITCYQGQCQTVSGIIVRSKRNGERERERESSQCFSQPASCQPANKSNFYHIKLILDSQCQRDLLRVDVTRSCLQLSIFLGS